MVVTSLLIDHSCCGIGLEPRIFATYVPTHIRKIAGSSLCINLVREGRCASAAYIGVRNIHTGRVDGIQAGPPPLALFVSLARQPVRFM